MYKKLSNKLKRDVITASEYIKKYENENVIDNIESSCIIPPVLGEPGFGKIQVTYSGFKALPVLYNRLLFNKQMT